MPGEDGTGRLHFNHTVEGLTTDIWATRDVPLDHNIGSERTSIAAIVERLVDENA